MTLRPLVLIATLTISQLLVLAAPPALAQGVAGPCTLTGYDPTIRPDPEGTPTDVRIGIYVVEIDRIDNVDQSFRIDFFVALFWRDSRLASAVLDAGRGQCRFPRRDVWEPQLVLFNRRDLSSQLPETITTDSEGNVRYVQRLYGDLRSRFDLRDFPIDSQALPLSAVSIEYGPDALNVQLDETMPSRTEEFFIPGWHVDDETHQVTVLETRAGDPSSPGDRFVRFDYTFHVSREVGYYIWRVIGPLTFIVFMSWAVFWIHPGMAGVQIALAATSMLTLVAFLFSLNAILPPLSYLTRMDVFLFASLALVFLAFAEAVATAVLSASDRERLASRFDRAARWIFPSLYLLIHLFTWRIY